MLAFHFLGSAGTISDSERRGLESFLPQKLESLGPSFHVLFTYLLNLIITSKQLFVVVARLWYKEQCVASTFNK